MAVRKKDAYAVCYYDCDDVLTMWSECQNEEHAMDEAKQCLTESGDDADTAFIVVKTHKITKDYKVEKL